MGNGKINRSGLPSDDIENLTSKLKVDPVRRKKNEKLERKYDWQIRHRLLPHIIHEDR